LFNQKISNLPILFKIKIEAVKAEISMPVSIRAREKRACQLKLENDPSPFRRAPPRQAIHSGRQPLCAFLSFEIETYKLGSVAYLKKAQDIFIAVELNKDRRAHQIPVA
jgi:hypothetical protein